MLDEDAMQSTQELARYFNIDHYTVLMCLKEMVKILNVGW